MNVPIAVTKQDLEVVALDVATLAQAIEQHSPQLGSATARG
jgi:hypothetical protein